MMFIRTCLLISLFSIMACRPSVLFNVPQPAGEKNLNSIPKRLHGTYVNMAELDTLVVTEKAVLLIDANSETGPKTEADSFYIVKGNIAIDRKSGDQFYCVQSGDSVTVYYCLPDTIFSLYREDVLRKYKGYFFMNRYYPYSEADNSSGWAVQRMHLKRGKIVLSWIGSVEDIENLMRNTESTKDTMIQQPYSPTRKQFTELLLDDGFSDGDVFVKVR
ncbi:MAG: hypothetical protein ACK5DJ_07240 [Bacteroidota bacterium]